MPAYNAEATLQKTYDEVMAQDVVDLVIVVDDCSDDQTVALASRLPRTLVHRHDDNRGYGGNPGNGCGFAPIVAGSNLEKALKNILDASASDKTRLVAPFGGVQLHPFLSKNEMNSSATALRPGIRVTRMTASRQASTRAQAMPAAAILSVRGR